MKTKLKLCKNWCIMIYFVLLFGERLQSVIRAFLNVEILKSRFEVYVTTITILSLSLFLMIFIFECLPFFRSLFSLNRNVQESIDLRIICLQIGVILLGGMVHTKYSIPALQFASYGFLIIGLILATIENIMNNQDKMIRIWSLIYLVCFSMAIPVTYDTAIGMKYVFYIAETVAMFILLLEFMLMETEIFLDKEKSLFQVRPIVFLVLLDTLVLLIRWHEEINWFVLVSVILSVVIWMIGFVINKKR